jgi:hypothetical protein
MAMEPLAPLAPSPPESPATARALHPLTGTPPRRGGTNKSLSLSPLARGRRLGVGPSVSSAGAQVGSPVPPSSPRLSEASGSPKRTAVQQENDRAEQRELEEIERLEQRLQELDVEEEARQSTKTGSTPAATTTTTSSAACTAASRRAGPVAGAAGMLALPDEVLERIVLAAERSLPQLSATCRRFRALVTSPEFDAVWLGQCAALLGNNNFRALHACGAARGRSSEEPVWRMIAIELRSGRLGGGGQGFAAHPASLCFAEPAEEAHYFGILSRVLGDSPASSDGAEQWHQWKHAPLRWRDGDERRAVGRRARGRRGLVEQFVAPDQSVKLELEISSDAVKQEQEEQEEQEEDTTSAVGNGGGGSDGSVESGAAVVPATRSWCVPRQVTEARILYRAEFVVGSGAGEKWEMSISYTPRTSLYLLHYLRSSNKPDPQPDPQAAAAAAAAETVDEELRFAEDRLLIQLGCWYEIPLAKLAAAAAAAAAAGEGGGDSGSEDLHRPNSYDMYGQEDPRQELALYLQDAESFCATAMQRYAQLQTGAVRAVAGAAGSSGAEVELAREQVDEVERAVAARVAVLRAHSAEFYAALRKGWELLQPVGEESSGTIE